MIHCMYNSSLVLEDHLVYGCDPDARAGVLVDPDARAGVLVEQEMCQA